MSRKPMFAVASTVVSIFATGIVPAAAQDQSAHAQSQIEGVKKQSAPAAPKQPEIETVVVTAERLSEARSGIQTQIGASTYTVTAQAIQNTPGGDNSQLNQVILQ